MSIAFVNDEESPLAREADALLPLCAGAERSVAATKSMIASLVAGASLVAHWSNDNDLLAALTKLPSVLDSSTAAPPATEAIDTLANASSLFAVGRGALPLGGGTPVGFGAPYGTKPDARHLAGALPLPPRARAARRANRLRPGAAPARPKQAHIAPGTTQQRATSPR